MTPRVDCPKTVAPGPYPVVSTFTGQAVTMTAADTSAYNSFTPTGRELLIIQNSAGSPGTYTIQSIADPQGRTGDLATIAIAANAIHVFVLNQLNGWKQADGTVWVKGSAVTILFGVVTYPG